MEKLTIQLIRANMIAILIWTIFCLLIIDSFPKAAKITVISIFFVISVIMAISSMWGMGIMAEGVDTDNKDKALKGFKFTVLFLVLAFSTGMAAFIALAQHVSG